MRISASPRTVRPRRIAAGTLAAGLGITLSLWGTVAPVAAATPKAPVDSPVPSVSEAPAVAAAGMVDLGSWMGQLRGTIGDRPLNKIVMPGSHDAGTAGITADSGICEYGDAAGVSKAWPGLAASMSRTQSGSLAEQLEGGSRYLDLRLCKVGIKWFSYHGGPMGRQFFDSGGPSVSGVKGEVNELADWIKRNPKEIVTIRLQTAVPKETATADNRVAIDALGAAIGGGASNPAIADGSLNPTSTYNEFMAAGKNVVFIDDTNSTDYDWAWASSAQSFRGSYVDVSGEIQDILWARLKEPNGVLGQTLTKKNIDAVLARGDKVFNTAPGGNADKFFVYEGILNTSNNLPDAAILKLMSYLPGTPGAYDNFLLFLGHQMNRALTAKFKQDWNHTNVTDNMNIVMTDDILYGGGTLQQEIISKNHAQKITPHTFYSGGRKADGSWTGPTALNGTGDSFRFVGSRQAVAATPGGGMQTAGIGIDGNIWHNIRRADGTWQGWNAMPGADGKTPGFSATDVALTVTPNGETQIVAVAKDGNVYHNIRHADADGTWQGWNAMPGADHGLMKASKIATAGMKDGSAQVIAYGSDGKMRLTTRGVNGVWTPWSIVAGVGAPDFSGSALAITSVPDGSSQIAAIGKNGGIWHNVRSQNGTWQGWSAPLGGSAEALAPTSVAITGMPDGSSQVLAAGTMGVFHTSRDSKGDWKKFQPIGGIQKGVTAFLGDQVGIAGMPDGSSQVLLTTR
ncbi:hypothetical protein [Streptomyces niveus]|uniref:hypothetical protein n=1 Tax=Streptomyces niveus TaxID=193462 RepID=UPI0036551CA2